MVQIHVRPKFAHIAPQMSQFYVFNMLCNALLSRSFKSQILPKYIRFMVLYARNSRVLLRKCTRFTS